MGGHRDDSDKPNVSLLPSKPLVGAAKVLTIAAKNGKYELHNWRKGIAFSRLYAAALRHMLKFNDNIDLDEETGLSHIHHAICNLMFLAEMWETRKDLDDRYKP